MRIGRERGLRICRGAGGGSGKHMEGGVRIGRERGLRI